MIDRKRPGDVSRKGASRSKPENAELDGAPSPGRLAASGVKTHCRISEAGIRRILVETSPGGAMPVSFRGMPRKLRARGPLLPRGGEAARSASYHLFRAARACR
jgi:hypothetical protein